MADMMEYKCPSCGGAMEFDSMTQKMKCPYCDTEMEVAQYQQMQEKAEGNAGGNQGGDAGENNENWSDMGNNQWMEGETDGIRVYVCQSCGGEIVADANTGATVSVAVWVLMSNSRSTLGIHSSVIRCASSGSVR